MRFYFIGSMTLIIVILRFTAFNIKFEPRREHGFLSIWEYGFMMTKIIPKIA